MAEDIIISSLWGFMISLVQLIMSLFVAISSVYYGVKLFDRSTKNIDEIKEMKKGNVAVGILLAAVVLSFANVVQVSVDNLLALIDPSQPVGVMLVALLIGTLQLVLGIIIAIFSIFLAIKVLDAVTKDIDEFKELKKGNVSIAIFMSGVLIAVSFVIRAGVAGLMTSIDPVSLAIHFGII